MLTIHQHATRFIPHTPIITQRVSYPLIERVMPQLPTLKARIELTADGLMYDVAHVNRVCDLGMDGKDEVYLPKTNNRVVRLQTPIGEPLRNPKRFMATALIDNNPKRFMVVSISAGQKLMVL